MSFTIKIKEKDIDIRTPISVNIKDEKNIYDITVIKGPTANCQLSFIASFINLLSIPDNELRYLLKDIKKQLGLREIIQIDINRHKVPKVEKALKGAIMHKLDYDSTNGSEMTIMLIKVVDL